MSNEITSSHVLDLVAKSKAALPAMYEKTQEEVDEMVRLIGRVVHDKAEMLAEMAVEETRMGNVPDKIMKCKAKSELIYGDLKDKKTVGIIKRDRMSGVIEIAEPVGVVAALIPTTNPAVTAMSNAMFAIKCRNTIVLSPHRRAFNTIKTTMDLMNEVGAAVGMPENTIQMISELDRENTRQLMNAADMVLATGGSAMVDAAYRSGTPSYGVGPGNVPVVIHDTADVEDACRRIVIGKAYDNGLICASEQAIFAPAKMLDEVIAGFKANKCYLVNDEEKARLRDVMWVDGHINPDIVGQSAADIAEMANITVPAGTKVLLVRESEIAKDNIFSKEKLSPVLALYSYNTFDEAKEGARRILENGGLGHSCGIHCNDDRVATSYAMGMPASRVLVNQSTATNAGGSKENGLVPTTTMGCGTWGKNATSDNVSCDHLMNRKRLAFKHALLRNTARIFEGEMMVG